MTSTGDPAALTFRTATAADVADLIALVRSAYRGEASRAGWTTEADLLDDQRIDDQQMAGKIAEPDGEVVLAFDGADLVACCELVHRGDGVVYFGMFAVRPALQAAGLGRQVLAEAERRAAQRWSARTIEMNVIGQRAELIAWYQRRGYTVTDETRPFPYAEMVGGSTPRDDLFFVVLTKSLPADADEWRSHSSASTGSSSGTNQ